MSEQTTKTIGILGGGQLGQMSAKAAKKFGIKTVIFTPEENSPASQVADETIIADYDNEPALTDFAHKVDVITYEFENIPVATVRFLQKIKPVYPDDKLLEVSQDRLAEKLFLNQNDIPTARWKAVRSVSDIQTTLEDWNTKGCIIKTTRFGYDGKGQVMIRGGAEDNTKNEAEITAAWGKLKADIAIAEEIIDFECEISVIIARDHTGHMETYGPCLNEHKNHILHKTTIPAPIPQNLALNAENITKKLAQAVNLRGVLALEMFVTRDGRILANEIAPRTHNSGHWTIDACAISQFENHVRTVYGMPAAPPARHSDAVMINLIGEDIHNLGVYEADKNAYIHDYGKTDSRPGRKMGHVTILKSKK